MFTQKDLKNSYNLRKVLKEAKYEVQGYEAFALSESIAWYNTVVVDMVEKDLKKQEDAKKMAESMAQAKKTKTPKPKKGSK